MAIEKCINEFEVGQVIFEEGSTGHELFVVLDGEVEIAKLNGAAKTVIVTLGKGEFFGEMAVIDGSSRSHALLSDTAQLFDALDARPNFEPIMQSVRDLNKLDDG
jgi:CRP/FNR family transcriptional regulator, cyclic AMP receptor protein